MDLLPPTNTPAPAQVNTALLTWFWECLSMHHREKPFNGDTLRCVGFIELLGEKRIVGVD
jgi:hypothetical protein